MSGNTGRTKFTFRSSGANTAPAGIVVCTAPASAVSTTHAIAPPYSARAGLLSHSVAGWTNTARPSSTSANRPPVKWWMGGDGRSPAMSAR